jgi:chromosome segregation ATPase
VKRHSEDSKCLEIDKAKHSYNEDLKHLESEVKRVEEEKNDLKAELAKLAESAQNEKEKFVKETLKLQIAYDNERRKSEGFERQTGDLREELLKIKQEKNKLKGSINAGREIISNLEEECKDLKGDNANLQKSNKDMIKLLGSKDA